MMANRHRQGFLVLALLHLLSAAAVAGEPETAAGSGVLTDPGIELRAELLGIAACGKGGFTSILRITLKGKVLEKMVYGLGDGIAGTPYVVTRVESRGVELARGKDVTVLTFPEEKESPEHPSSPDR